MSQEGRPGLLLALIALAEYAAPWRTPGRALTFVIALVLVWGFVRDSLRHVRLAIRVPDVIEARLFEGGLCTGRPTSACSGGASTSAACATNGSST